MSWGIRWCQWQLTNKGAYALVFVREERCSHASERGRVLATVTLDRDTDLYRVDSKITRGEPPALFMECPQGQRYAEQMANAAGFFLELPCVEK